MKIICDCDLLLADNTGFITDYVFYENYGKKSYCCKDCIREKANALNWKIQSSTYVNSLDSVVYVYYKNHL